MTIDNDRAVSDFLAKLAKHAQRKRELYDGVNRAATEKDTPSTWLRYLTEEVGEVAAAITRSRWELARQECIDVAHCAMLLHLALGGTGGTK